MVDINLDHFKFYEIIPPLRLEFEKKILLQGQFDKRPLSAKLVGLKYFANPVDKEWGEDQVRRQNREAHLSWYQLHQEIPEQTRKVTVENQFGYQKLYIGNPVALLVPAWKSLTSEPFEPFEAAQLPQDLDHFKLYEVLDLEGNPVSETVRLTDQFNDESGFDPDIVRVTYPIAFGVPVSKKLIEENESYPIRNKEAHLMIYNISSHYAPKFPRRLIRDQFLPSKPYEPSFSIIFVRSTKLAVPTHKRHVQVITDM